jgi:hypothetical protein
MGKRTRRVIYFFAIIHICMSSSIIQIFLLYIIDTCSNFDKNHLSTHIGDEG